MALRLLIRDALWSTIEFGDGLYEIPGHGLAFGRIRHCHPAFPIENALVFVSPLRPFAAVRYLLGKGFVTAPNLLYGGSATGCWDELFGAFHDGTREATARLRRRQAARRAAFAGRG